MEEQGERTYLRKISPRVGLRKTTRHSELCTLGQKSFLGPSTSKGGEPMEVEDKEWEPNLAKTWRKNFHYRCTQLLRLAQKSLDSATKQITGCIFGTYISFSDIIWIFVNIPGQAKVTNFNHVLFRQEDVPCCQVPVDTLQKELCALRVQPHWSLLHLLWPHALKK